VLKLEPLKILLCSDLAGKDPSFPRELIATTDAVLLAGDITLGAKSETRAEKNFQRLGELFPPPIPVYFIPGNHDYSFIADPQPWIPTNFVQLHNRAIIVPLRGYSITIIGFGGAKLGLYNNFAFPEEEIFVSLDHLFHNQRINQLNSSIDKNLIPFTILLVHDPPFNTKLDYNLQKQHVGSEAIRRIVEMYQPNLTVAGHIHESPAIDHIDKTFLINPGEGKYDRYATITIINGNVDASLL
jgi:Icc-related predicted phosphoesterase